ncbi:MAG TPA: dUTP diphosphatase [bacterium]|nr:dUTP diphosphatase [bacterium]HQO91458.1 dUTP diphosphatase [bacterium]
MTIADADISIKFKLENGAVLPSYETGGSSGMDVRSVEDCVIESNSWKLISTGLFPETPSGYEIQVRSRSGLAAKYGVFVLNSPGTVDSDYRGEIKIILANMGSEIFKISKGDRIAQLVVSPVTKATVISVDTISNTERGVGGFGSTGKN